jgi:dihydrofolate reductase
MGKLTYTMMVSLDGYVAAPDGRIVGIIDEEVHAFANRETMKVGAELYGRRMYQTMAVWENWDGRTDRPAFERDFARIWKGIDKIVFSSTLDHVASARTRIERTVEPQAILALKAGSEKPISVSGPRLAARFLALGLVDEIGMYLVPVITGGGTPFFRDAAPAAELDLIEEHHFGNSTVFLRYRLR